jgi:hypothetical protein
VAAYSRCRGYVVLECQAAMRAMIQSVVSMESAPDDETRDRVIVG